MGHCPSHDWDDHVRHEDEAMAAEVAFYRDHRDLIVATTAGLLAGRQGWVGKDDREYIKQYVDTAAAIVAEVVNRGRDPYE